MIQPKLIKIGVLVSGRGTNLQSIIDACENSGSSYIPGKVVVVISNKKDAYALQRAEKHNIEALFIDRKLFLDDFSYSDKLIQELKLRNVDLVCLAGFLLKLAPNFIQAFKNRILNIHPALLPDFGGKGMYGLNVHKAVLQSGVKVTGCSVHIVDEEYDHGEIILQRKVPVLDNDTPEILANRVLEQEHKLYPEAIKLFIEKYMHVGTDSEILNEL